MNVTQTKIPGVLVIEPKIWGDDRGFFLETYQNDRYAEAGVATAFVQDNLSFSRRGVLRGLHFQNPRTQGKLIQVIEGRVWDVVVDIRVGSPTFGQWVGIDLDGKAKRQVWVPAGMAHGFVVTSETALFSYKCTDLYSPATEHCVAWDDPDIGVTWPLDEVGGVAALQLSPKDKAGKRLKDIDRAVLPVF